MRQGHHGFVEVGLIAGRHPMPVDHGVVDARHRQRSGLVEEVQLQGRGWIAVMERRHRLGEQVGSGRHGIGDVMRSTAGALPAGARE